MKTIALVFLSMCVAGQCFAGVALTDSQYNSLHLINVELSEKYPQFTGFNGPKHDMEFFGISEETVIAELEVINIDALKAVEFEADEELDLVEKQIFDLAVDELEKGGKTLKHKDKLRKKYGNSNK